MNNHEDPLRPEVNAGHPLLRIENLSKSYARPGKEPIRLFERLTLSVERGLLVAIIGPSGSGKSSLLHLLGALDQSSEGEIWLGATALSALSGRSAAQFRNREVGFLWQLHHLLPEFSAEENVAMPLVARGIGLRDARERARVWLERVGLGDRATHRAGELSGGEQQRVSLARALVTQPRLLLADEPTGDLDEETAEAIFSLLLELHRQGDLTTVLVTHNISLARRCHRVLRLRQGSVQELSAAEL